MTDDDPDVINLNKARRGKWQNDCIKGRSGRLLPIVANALLALRRDGGLKDAFAYDEMQRTLFKAASGEVFIKMLRETLSYDISASSAWSRSIRSRRSSSAGPSMAPHCRRWPSEYCGIVLAAGS